MTKSNLLPCGSRRPLTHLATGADTREVTQRMFLSEDTIQDHLKSTFAKTGTHNRRTLSPERVGPLKTGADRRLGAHTTKAGGVPECASHDDVGHRPEGDTPARPAQRERMGRGRRSVRSDADDVEASD